MRKIFLSISLSCLLLLGGCGDILNIEDTILMLVLGIDEGKEKRLTFYQSSPVFSEEAQEKSQVLEVQANSVREAKQLFDVMSDGTVVTGKIQSLVFSKKVLENEDPLPIIDFLCRDAKSSSNVIVVMFNGPLDPLMRLQTPDKPRFGIFMNNLLESAYKKEMTSLTTIATLRKAKEEKGATPYIPELMLEKDGIRVTGIALLNNDAKYVDSINNYESAMLLLLTKQITEPVSFILEMIPDTKVVSLNITEADYDYQVKNVNGQLTFNLNIEMDVTLKEMVMMDEKKPHSQKVLTKMIEKEINNQLEAFIQKMQKLEIDPFGLGIYVRAYEYEKWKEIEDRWTEEFSKTKVNVKTKVRIKDNGIIDKGFK